MSDKPEDRKCSFNQTGVCSLHEAEWERREGDRTRFTDLKEEFDKFKSTAMRLISDLCTFKNRTLGIGVLGTIVVLGAYAFTGIISAQTDAKCAAMSKRVDAVDERAHDNKTQVAVMLSRLDTTNDRLAELIKIISKDYGGNK